MNSTTYTIMRIAILTIMAAAATGPLHAAKGEFVEVDGHISIEAENYKEKSGTWQDKSGTDNMSSSASGNKWMYTNSKGAALIYTIKIKTAGTWYLNARTWSTGHNDNGCEPHIDEKLFIVPPGLIGEGCGDKCYIAKTNKWDWDTHIQCNGGVPSWELTAGTHTLQYKMRDNEHRVDKIVLYEGSKYTVPTHTQCGKFTRPDCTIKDFPAMGWPETIEGSVPVALPAKNFSRPAAAGNYGTVYSVLGKRLAPASAVSPHGLFIIAPGNADAHTAALNLQNTR